MQVPFLKYVAIGGVALAALPLIAGYRITHPDISPSVSGVTASGGRHVVEIQVQPSAPSALSGGSHAMVVVPANEEGNFVVEAQIGKATLSMLFDTGANVVALSFEDARKAGISVIANQFRSRIETANGAVDAAEVQLAELRVGAIVEKDVKAYVLPPGRSKVSLLGRSFWGRLATGFSITGSKLVLQD